MILSTLCYIERNIDGKGQYLMLHRVKKENDCNHDKWIGVGGKFQEGESPEECLLREVREESGLVTVTPVTPELYSLEILTVDGHEKHGRYVSSHLHLNVTYLLEADPAAPVRRKPDENSAVAWFGLEEAVAASSEPWFRDRIYRKLNAKLALFSGEQGG